MRCVIALVVLAVVALLAPGSSAMAMPHCHPSILQSGTESIRKVCDVMMSYIYDTPNSATDEKSESETLNNFAAMIVQSPCCQLLLRENMLLDRGVKRQDVDHVFLRFGRR